MSNKGLGENANAIVDWINDVSVYIQKEIVELRNLLKSVVDF